MTNANEQSLKDALLQMVEHYRLRSRLTQVRINKCWATVMGPSIAQYTSDIKVRKNKLFVTITSAALKQELSYGKDKILRNLNDELGEDLITDIEIR